MAIYEHTVNENHYYRVFRAWGGTEYQEYVRIKRSKEVAYKKALIIDERLAAGERAYILKQALTPGFHIRPDGRVRGLRRIIVKKKGRADAEIFELRINVPWEEDIYRTTISIPVHGLKGAFDRSIALITEWYGLTPQSDVLEAIKETFPVYERQGNTSNDNTVKK